MNMTEAADYSKAEDKTASPLKITEVNGAFLGWEDGRTLFAKACGHGGKWRAAWGTIVGVSFHAALLAEAQYLLAYRPLSKVNTCNFAGLLLRTSVLGAL